MLLWKSRRRKREVVWVSAEVLSKVKFFSSVVSSWAVRLKKELLMFLSFCHKLLWTSWLNSSAELNICEISNNYRTYILRAFIKRMSSVSLLIRIELICICAHVNSDWNTECRTFVKLPPVTVFYFGRIFWLGSDKSPIGNSKNK